MKSLMGLLMAGFLVFVGASVTPAYATTRDVQCRRAVHSMARALNSDDMTDDEYFPIEAKTLRSCKNVSQWEHWASYYEIPLGNTPVGQVLASACWDSDHAQTTAVCKHAPKLDQ